MIVAAWEGKTDTLAVERTDEGHRLHGLGIDRTLGPAWSEADAVWHANWISSARFSPPLKRILLESR